jgi:hypothetical protein
MMEYMTPELYAETRYFKNYRTEGWGTPCSMAKVLVFGADKLRHIAKAPLIVHCGIEDRDKGYHPLGMAFDFHLVGIPLLQQLYLALQIPEFNGIGVYPNWNNVGLHCDIGKLSKYTGTKRIWKAKYVMVNNKKVQKYERLDNIYKLVYR